MKKIFYSILALSMIFATNSCETTELDLLESPTQVGQDQLDPQFLFNNIQLNFAGFASTTGGYGSFASSVTRQFSMTGSSVYAGAYSPGTFNGIWSNAYAGLLQDIQTLENFPEAETNFSYQLGVSKILKAQVLFTLVDFFGDVPLEEALQGADNQSPNYTDQVSVYLAAFDELNQGRALLASGTGIEPLEDFFYGLANSSTSRTKWITAANSLELRALNNGKAGASDLGIDVAGRITALLNDNNLIDNASEDLQFNYGANRLNPNTRHPGYSLNYENDSSGYLANYLMWEMTQEKGFDDPRLFYYFYRQDTNAQNEDIFTLGCAVQSAPGHYASVTSIYEDVDVTVPFCTAVPSRGYWGRDHGDDNGIPPDNTKRTVWGLYPAGGAFDVGDAAGIQNEGSDGLLGAGIEPILLSSHVAFIKSEIALELGIGDAQASLEEAIRFSMDKVTSFGGLNPSTIVVADDTDTAANEEVLLGEFLATQAQIDNYVNFVNDAYDQAIGNDAKLNVVMKEHHIASFGNGLEVYNAYRRTGFPNNMQPSLNPNPGDFYRSAFYPDSSINNNPNAQQADISRQVFWDKNPAGFIN